MRVTFSDEQVLVVDDFLIPSLVSDLWDEVQQLDYRSWKSEIWHKHYPLDSGDLYEGEVFMDLAVERAGVSTRQFMIALTQFEERFEYLTGKREEHWDAFTVRASVMPAGSGLSWHEDGGSKKGAFVYYLHPRWGVRWGGELMVAQRLDPALLAEVRAKQQHRRPYFETLFLDQLLEAPGLGTYIAPRPNRLVVLKGGTWHCVRRVEAAAGDALRVTLSGFFFKAS